MPNGHTDVNIGPGNDLLPDSTKPLSEPMLICYQLGPHEQTSVKF